MTSPTAVTRGFFEHDGLRLSYLDTGAPDPDMAGTDTAGSDSAGADTARADTAGADSSAPPVLLALHAHLNEARFITQGAVPDDLPYRIIAPDHRGHGESDHADRYEVEDYVGDSLALLEHLGVDRVSVLGHSLGGVVAYSLAAREPDRVPSLVVIDIGAENDGDLTVTETWPRRAPTRAALVAAFGDMGPKQEYVMREYPDGWGVPWDPDDMVASQRAMNGDRWSVWLASDMPTLLFHGLQSSELSDAQASEMARRRPGTELVVLDTGHAVYVDAPEEYTRAVSGFFAS